MAKRDRMTLQVEAFLYACPRCGAVPGGSCTRGTGGSVPTLAPHNERVDQPRQVKQAFNQSPGWKRRGFRQ
jgi:hypothetical protein